MSFQYTLCDQIVKAVAVVFCMRCCYWSVCIYKKMAEFHATKTSKELFFFFLSLTLVAKWFVIGQRCSASWQSHYCPRTNMSQLVDIKNLSESTKQYYLWLKSVMTHMMLASCQSRTVSYLCYVRLFYWWTKKFPLKSKSCHKCQQIIELGIKLCLISAYVWVRWV